MSWSLPSKMTYIGTVVGILAFGIYGIDKFNESMGKRMHERLFASMSANVRSNIFSYYLLNEPFRQELTIVNKSIFDWRDVTLTTYSVMTLNHNVDLDNPDSYMRVSKKSIGLLAAGSPRTITFSPDMPSDYFGSLNLSGVGTTATYDLILNPFKYSIWHSRVPLDLTEKAPSDPAHAQDKALFMKAINITRDRNPFLDFIADILSVSNTVRGGVIDIVAVTGDAMTSYGPQQFLSLIPIVNAWQSSSGSLLKVKDIVFYNSIIDVPLFFEIDGNKLTPRDCQNTYAYERPILDGQVKARLLTEGYKVDLMHFIIKNITYKELASFNVSGNFLAVYGTKTIGGLSTLAPNETINAGIQFTPLRNGRYPASQYQIQYDLDHL